MTWSTTALSYLESTVGRLGLDADAAERLRGGAESRASEKGKTLVGLTILNEAIADVLGESAAVEIPSGRLEESYHRLDSYDVRVGIDQIDRLEGWLNGMRIDVEEMQDGDPVARELVEQKLLGATATLAILGLTPRIGGDTDGPYARSIYIDLPGNRPGEMTVGEAADYLGVSDARIRQLLTEEHPRLAGRKAGGVWVIDRNSVEAYGAAR